jgi:6-phosphofructokinase 1
MGHYAVELLLSGIGKRVVAMRDDKIVDYDIKEALELKKRPKTGLFKVAEDISI